MNWIPVGHEHGYRLRTISGGTNTRGVWGTNSDSQIFKWAGDGFRQAANAHRLIQITVGHEDEIWGINNDDQVFIWDGNSFNQIPGALLTCISSGRNGNIWGVNSDGLIFKWNGHNFPQVAIPHRLAQISVGFDGDVWGVNSSDQVFRLSGQEFYQPRGYDKLVCISVAHANYIWGVNREGQVFKWNGSGWSQILSDSIYFKYISASPSGLVLGIDIQDRIWIYAFLGDGDNLFSMFDPARFDDCDRRKVLQDRALIALPTVGEAAIWVGEKVLEYALYKVLDKVWDDFKREFERNPDLGKPLYREYVEKQRYQSEKIASGEWAHLHPDRQEEMLREEGYPPAERTD